MFRQIRPGGYYFVKSKDANDFSGLQMNKYGPNLSLKNQYASVCNNIADQVPEFGQFNEKLSIDEKFGQPLVFRTSELANKIANLGPPTIDE